jgi:hypothetical protein
MLIHLEERLLLKSHLNLHVSPFPTFKIPFITLVLYIFVFEIIKFCVERAEEIDQLSNAIKVLASAGEEKTRKSAQSSLKDQFLRKENVFGTENGW